MSIKQLFSEPPPRDLIMKVLNNIGFDDLNDEREISIFDLSDNATKVEMRKLVPDLEEYYIPCKASIYLRNLTEKKCITICRQLLKIINYTFITREKYIKTKKYTMYKLIPINKKKTHDMLKKNGEILIKFN
jgi:hypothetical protein